MKAEIILIDPDGKGGLAPFSVYCDMKDKNGIGVTVISHDSESRTYVPCQNRLRDIHYTIFTKSESVSVGQSHQCLLTLWAVY